MNTALEHLKKIDRPRDSIQIGAYINLVCDEDEQRALSLGQVDRWHGRAFCGTQTRARPITCQPNCARSLKVCSRSTTWHVTPKKREHTSSLSMRLLSTGSRSVAHRTNVSSAWSHSSIWDSSTSISWEALRLRTRTGARQVAMVEQAKLFASDVMPRFR
jgi:hypothetical protein